MTKLSRRAALLLLASLAPAAVAADAPALAPNASRAEFLGGAWRGPAQIGRDHRHRRAAGKSMGGRERLRPLRWLPGIARVEASGGNTPEKAKRKLLMADGGVVEETLVRWDAERMTVAFHRDHDDVKRLPAINYMTHVTVKPADEGKALAEWKGRFYRGHPFNDPPTGLDDDAALAAVIALHRANLAALKAWMESDFCWRQLEISKDDALFRYNADCNQGDKV